MLFNQKAILKTKKKTDEYAESEYIVMQIKCRVEFKYTVIYEVGGKILHANAKIYTKTECQEGDFITYNGKKFKILGVDENVDINGKNQFYTYLIGK